MQKNDGKPIHLKNGAGDSFLYYTTVAACAAGVAGAGHLFYSIIWPKTEE